MGTWATRQQNLEVICYPVLCAISKNANMYVFDISYYTNGVEFPEFLYVCLQATVQRDTQPY
jgi:hypothetical protein